MSTHPVTQTITLTPPLTPKQRVHTDEIANEVYAAHYSERKIARMALGAFAGISLVLTGALVLVSHRPPVTRYVRIDDVGIPFSEVAVREGIVVGLCGEFTILHLNVPAWGKGGEGTLEHLFGFGEAA